LGIDFAGTNTAREAVDLPAMEAGDVVTVDFHLDVPELYPGDFSFSPAVANGPLDGYEMCDWIENALILPMSHSGGPVYGYIHLPCRVQVNSRLKQSKPAEASISSWKS
jgi:lipopolysaccharide transport system ATP-binding protein